LFENEYRYLGAFLDLGTSWNGTFKHQFARNDTTKETSRYFYTKHEQKLLSSKGVLFWDYQKVSDPSYFSQWSLNQTDASQSSLKQEIGFQYTTDLTKSMARNLQYQTLKISDIAQTPSYSRKAQAAFEFQKLNYKDLDIFFDLDYNQFRHPTLTEGDRTASKLSLTYYGLRKMWGFIKPSIKLNRNHYQIYSRNTSVANTDKHLEVPQFILDTGLFFDKEFTFLDTNLRQSIEPRLVYQYTPYRQQDDLPSFDSARLDLNFASIFNDNLYSGRDRFVNAKQITVGAQSRLFNEYDGAELLRVALARRFYFEDQLVSLSGETIREGTSSDYFGALAVNIASKWQADAAVQYSASLNQFQKTNWSVRWKPESFKTIAFSYRSDKDIINPTQQVELGAQWKLANRWVPVIRLISDLKNDRSLERLFGVEYRSNCWVLRLAYQAYPKYDGSEGTNHTFFIQLSLDGLGAIGKSPLTEFKKGVLGYQPLEAVRSLPRQGLWYEN
jgi:LPS-assembly protein